MIISIISLVVIIVIVTIISCMLNTYMSQGGEGREPPREARRFISQSAGPS